MQIKINNLSKTINNNLILNNINLTMYSGNIYGIVGNNGSGKTMLLRAISGMIIPTEGTVSIDEKILHKDISYPPEMGILIEKPEFIGHLSGFKNLTILSSIKELITMEQINKIMQQFGLDPDSKLPVRKYSLGMKQKLGIIQAVMEDQQLLVLDEAFNALDETAVHMLRNLLLLYKEKGKLIIITSHNKEDIMTLCDFIYLIDKGSIVSVKEI